MVGDEGEEIVSGTVVREGFSMRYLRMNQKQ